MKKGMTIFELLVVIIIVAILSAGVIKAIQQALQKTQPYISFVKQQQDVESIVNFLLMDYSSIGFGVAANNLSSAVSNVGTKDPTQNPSCFQTASGDMKLNSYCWATIDSNGIITVNSLNATMKSCPTDRNSYLGSCFDFQKNALSNCNSCINCIVFAGQVGSVCYDLSAVGNRDRRCAPGTFVLRRKWGNGTPQPIVDCVRSYGVRYIVKGQNGIQYQDQAPTDITNLLGIRMCMILQVGGKQSTSQPEPQFSQSCNGVVIQNVNEGGYYRWQVIEKDIPLKNIN